MMLIDDEKEEKELAEIRQKEEEELIRFLAEKHGLPYIDLTGIPIESDALRLIPEEEARAARMTPFAQTGKKVSVAALSPHNEAVTTAIEKLRRTGVEPTLYLTSTKGLEKAWRHYEELRSGAATRAGAMEMQAGEVAETASRVKTLPELIPLIQEVVASREANRVSRLVSMLIGGAIAIDASDIHIEPEERDVRVRVRLDGILEKALTFDRATYALVNSRIKLLAGLKLNVRSEAQDGRFSVNLKEEDIEIRVSSLPGAYGESVVLRVLNPRSIAVALPELGMQPILLEAVLKEISKPNGMLLTTGPTGSGKTTTLYAFVRKIHTPGVKIITIEDPIEYHLQGITQTQTGKEKGYTFALGLRSALRQDPDVIMVGEIRDEETAEIAVNAALTGHLVFSTLHTNNAAGTFPRLIDLGVNPKVITSAINLAMAQRLVRKLCPSCKIEKPLPEKDRVRMAKVLERLEDAPRLQNDARLWTAKGCEKCNNTGYKGRTGIYEAILADAA
ncbi:MAG: type IV pilus assembly protein PilB, partial [Parcubacteria group bacterium Greene0416_79]